MKKYILIAASAILMQPVIAQKIDRTHAPKAGPAPVIKINDPATFTLPNGITVLVVENKKVPKISATYSIDAGPITEGSKAGVTELMGAMLNEGTQKHTKAQFDEAVDQMGADVSLNSGGGRVAALDRYFEKAFDLFAEALLQPAFQQESFDKLKSQTITGLKTQEKDAKAIAGRVTDALLYGKDHPKGEFETETSVNGLTLGDIKEAYQKYITPSRGYLVFVGDITPARAKTLAQKAFGSWKGSLLTWPGLAQVKNPSKTEINLVDVPNAVQSIITVANLVSLPLSDPDYFPVTLANNILGGGSEARLFKNLREKHGFTYGAYSRIGSGRTQAAFSASASVRNAVTDSAITEFLNEIKHMRTDKVSDEELKNAKALYNGQFALGTESPSTVATYALNILTNKLQKDFYRTYLQKINAVTADDILRVAKKYFSYDNARIIVTGKAGEIKDGLQKLGYPVKEYDKFAEPVTAAIGTPTAGTAGIKAEDIIAKFISVTGGLEEWKKVTSIQATGTMSMQGMNLNVSMKAMPPNRSLMQISMGENTIMKRVLNGKAGYNMQMGQKKEMTPDEIANTDENGILPQADYQNGKYKLELQGVEKIDGKDAYKIKVTKPSGKAGIEFYDAASYLLVRQDNSLTAQGQEISQSVGLSNYKKIGNILYPLSMATSVQTPMGNQEFTMEFKEVKLNEGVSAEDFK
ncbi:insulinase family protein [Niabella drilacis]|uniref:Predicted Zn-dependent peptidase n=1 Tax=Niabella drilacis (strain DSM 25811 / CCM 8410 / CCUG 62505 / LMG 26954 / E90) TaxID=1285928 RepID=A0A1G6J489_NIADE|nr:insulinase family protein [Niabella drilacis]SDC13622.1 Predicted Zn-dependent peptidase [Niabella drilacis]